MLLQFHIQICFYAADVKFSNNWRVIGCRQQCALHLSIHAKLFYRIILYITRFPGDSTAFWFHFEDKYVILCRLFVQLKELEKAVNQLRQRTGRSVVRVTGSYSGSLCVPLSK